MNKNTGMIDSPLVLSGDPDLPEILADGLRHHQAQRAAEAERAYVQYLQDNPGDAQALAFLGNLKAQNEEYDVALWLLSTAVQNDGNLADPRFCIANILSAQGRLSEAVTPYTNAMALGHPLAEERLNSLFAQLGADGRATSHRVLANFYLSRNETELAIESARQAIHLGVEDSRNWRVFSRCLAGIRFTTPVSEDLLADIANTFRVENLDYRQLVRAAISALVHDPQLSELFTASRTGEDAIQYMRDSCGKGGFDKLAEHQLLRRMLELAVVTDLELERLLTSMRAAFLWDVTEAPAEASDQATYLPLVFSLAQQCFLNEYVWSASTHELKVVGELSNSIAARLYENDTVPAGWVAVLAMYTPLYRLSYAAQLQKLEWSGGVESVIRMQLTEPMEEARIRKEIPNLLPIATGVSQLVRSQYEENPFPRWATLPVQDEPVSLEEYMGCLFPHLPEEERKQSDAPSILVAGCGTGLIPNYFAKHIKRSQVTALDLSLSSLAYAKRKSIELNIANVEYIHGDILNLPTLGSRFDHINCYGVLHHMEDVESGWKALIECLKPDGTMQIGLYSKIARRPVSRAHDFIEERGYRPTAEDMRLCRQDIIAQKDDALLQMITQAPDFYSMSELRDLIFHCQEHFLTLPEIAEMIDALGLTFLGFEHQDPSIVQRYRNMFPQDHDMRSLELWDKFETENPLTFASIYNFWVRKSG